MAKKAGEFSFNDLNSLLNKNSKFGGLMSDGAGVSEITEYIKTGNYILNAAFSGSLFKGIPNNRTTIVSGQSGVGKTYIMLNIAREAQKQGYYIIWYDSENAIDSSQVISFGVDPSTFRYEPVGTIQEFRTNITNIVDTLIEQKENGNQIPKVCFFLDSLGNLATQKEVDDAKSGSDKADMSRAKSIRSIFRILMSKLGIINAVWISSNHTYQSMDLFSVETQSGGGGVNYGASIIMNCSKAKLKEGSDNSQTGIVVSARPQKNRFCKPTVVKFHISYVHGMNPYVGLEDYVSWDRCGIERGKFITAKEFEKLSDGDKEDCRKVDDDKYFEPSETGRNICLDNGESVPLKELFTKKVFSDDRLKRLDEFIQKEFMYAKGSNDIFDIIDGETSNEDEKEDVDDDIKNQLLYD